jgi:hypothetical protein
LGLATSNFLKLHEISQNLVNIFMGENIVGEASNKLYKGKNATESELSEFIASCCNPAEPDPNDVWIYTPYRKYRHSDKRV